jgi:hypothetical protein
MLVQKRKCSMQYDYEKLSEQEFRARVVVVKSKRGEVRREEELAWGHASGSKAKARLAAAEIGLRHLSCALRGKEGGHICRSVMTQVRESGGEIQEGVARKETNGERERERETETDRQTGSEIQTQQAQPQAQAQAQTQTQTQTQTQPQEPTQTQTQTQTQPQTQPQPQTQTQTQPQPQPQPQAQAPAEHPSSAHERQNENELSAAAAAAAGGTAGMPPLPRGRGGGGIELSLRECDEESGAQDVRVEQQEVTP